jgi:hypothetical protein
VGSETYCALAETGKRGETMTPDAGPPIVPEVIWTQPTSRPQNELAKAAYILACLGPCAAIVMASMYPPTNSKALPALPVQILWWMLACSSPLGCVLGAIAYRVIRRSPVRVAGGSHAVAAVVVGLVASVCLPISTLELTATRKSFGRQGANVSCMSNLKQLGVGMMMYVQDYDESYPLSASWNAATLPYIKNEHVYRCPLEEDQKTPSYAMNRRMNGVLLKNVADPAQAVLLFDSIPGTNRAGGKELLPDPSRHRSFQVIGFADSHVKSIGNSNIASLQWILQQVPKTTSQQTKSAAPPGSSKRSQDGAHEETAQDKEKK